MAPNITVQEARIVAPSEPASSTVTASGAASSGATGLELQATALSPHSPIVGAGAFRGPDRVGNIFDIIIERNTGSSGGTGSGLPDLPSSLALAIREDAVVEEYQSRASRASRASARRGPGP